MKKIFITFVLLINTILFSQEKVELNTIITLNNEICKNLIEVKFFKNDNMQINGDYLPGKLLLDKNEFKILKESEENISIEIIVPKLKKDEVFYNKFFIKNINFKLLLSDYFILRIYDLSCKKYKKKYYPLEGTNFTFEYDSPLETIKRATK